MKNKKKFIIILDLIKLSSNIKNNNNQYQHKKLKKYIFQHSIIIYNYEIKYQIHQKCQKIMILYLMH